MLMANKAITHISNNKNYAYAVRGKIELHEGTVTVFKDGSTIIDNDFSIKNFANEIEVLKIKFQEMCNQYY